MLPSYGQTYKPSADRYFEAQQYYRAAPLYQAQYAQDTTDMRAAFYLAECYRHLFQYASAVPYYRRVYEQAPDRFPASGFYYGLMLKSQQRCAEAIPVLEAFMHQHPDSELRQRAQAEQQGCYALQLSPDSVPVILMQLPLPVNSSYQEYAPVVFQHDSSLILTTTRRRGATEAINRRSGEGFARQRWFVQGKNRWKAKPTAQLKKLNQYQSEGAGYWDANRQAYYFTHCDEAHCSIVVSYYVSERWSEPQALGEVVNAPNTNSKHPALSKGGDTLFFVSDRAGGQGGTDLWMSTQQKGVWSSAINLGSKINTAYDEISPFYDDQEALLFFASNGRGGIGGMDLYVARRGNARRGNARRGDARQNGIVENAHEPTVRPLPFPFNTEADDCFLTLGQTRGYLTSNRAGSFDIYSFARDTVSLSTQLFGAPLLASSSAFLASGKTLPRDISLRLPTHERMTVRSAGQEQLLNGSTRFVLSSDVGDIALRERKHAAQSTQGSPEEVPAQENTAPLSPVGSQIVATVSTDQVKQDQTAEAAGVLYQATPSEPLIKTKIYLLNQAGDVVKITTTNEQGAFRFLNLAPQSLYALTIDPDVALLDMAIGVKDLVVQAYGAEMKMIPYETIYFDFNQAGIRPEGQVVLQELAQYYQRHPGLAIEINAFADSLGNDQYNYALSQQRGTSVFEQLLQQGVNRSDVVINAQGVSTARSSSHALVSQQLNRRVELSVVGRNLRYRPTTETRIPRPNVSLAQIAEQTGVSVATLRALNGLDETMEPFQPLRIPLVSDSVAAPLFYPMIQTQPSNR